MQAALDAEGAALAGEGKHLPLACCAGVGGLPRGLLDAEEKKHRAKLRFIKRATQMQHDLQGDDDLEPILRDIVRWLSERSPRDVRAYQEKVLSFLHGSCVRPRPFVSQVVERIETEARRLIMSGARDRWLSGADDKASSASCLHAV